MPTKNISVSPPPTAQDPWSPQYGVFDDDKKMAPVEQDLDKKANMWMTSAKDGGGGGGKGEVRMTKKQVALAAEVAKAWRESTESWSEFTQHTTFHGIKYIFSSQAKYKWRRVVWLVCVLGSLTVFLWNVGQRLDTYFQYKTNVDVQIIYTNTSPLPAVTLCNQNNFRITNTNATGLYHFIDEFYGTDNISAVDETKYDLERIETRDFILGTAHQLEDLIDSCTWRGKPCNLTSDFDLALTDLGVCYTFNSGRRMPVFEVTDSGSSFALSLVMNVEQYEYMRGPQNDAGVKILLHDQGDFPLVKDLGFAAAPGTHTLVGVHRTEVKSLPAPYGDCNPDSERSFSDCILECRTQEIIRRCGCRDIYMPDLHSGLTPVCNMTYAFKCVAVEMMKLRRDQVSCQCSVPCHRSHYEPSLSFAQLSRFNIERLVLNDPSRRTAVESRFIFAQEVNQRVDVSASMADSNAILSIKDHVEKLEAAMEVKVGVLENKELHGKLNALHEALKDDKMTLKRWLFNLLASFAVNTRKVLQVEDFFHTLFGILKLRHQDDHMTIAGSGLLEELEECKYNLTAPYNLSTYIQPEGGRQRRRRRRRSPGGPHGGSDGEDYFSMYGWDDDIDMDDLYDWMAGDEEKSSEELEAISDTDHEFTGAFVPKLPSERTCDDKMRDFFQMVSPVYTGSLSTLAALEGILPSYLRKVAETYNNTAVNPEDVEEHGACTQALEDVTLITTPLLEDAVQVLHHMTQTEDINTLLDHMEQIVGKYNSTEARLAQSIYEALRRGVCYWIKHYISADDAKKFERDFDNGIRTFDSIKPRLDLIKDKIGEMQRITNTSVRPELVALDNYMSLAITKQSMAALLTGDDLDKGISDLNDMTLAYSSMAMSAQEEINSGTFTTMSLFRQLFDLQVPILNDERVGELELTRLARGLGSDDIDQLLDTLADNRKVNYLKVISLVSSVTLGAFQELMEELIKQEKIFKSTMKMYIKKLNNYLDNLVLDESFFMENFLQVDIFYKQLKYELVQQHEAFELLSLFSEVGGFLGLLLGASVLTVCELVDHIILSVLDRWHRRKGVGAGGTGNKKHVFPHI